MAQKTVTITAPHGIHTRPAALLVKAAKAYSCDITIECAGRQANAKSLFRLQTLSLSLGAQATVSAKGEQAELAVNDIATLLHQLQ